MEKRMQHAWNYTAGTVELKANSSECMYRLQYYIVPDVIDRGGSLFRTWPLSHAKKSRLS
jgi:hypothetical protein